MSVVANIMLSLMSVMSPPCNLCTLSVRMLVKLYTLDDFALRVSLVSLILICVCGVIKHFELLEFINVGLKHNEIFLNLTAGSVCLCSVCRLSVRLSRHPM